MGWKRRESLPFRQASPGQAPGRLPKASRVPSPEQTRNGSDRKGHSLQVWPVQLCREQPGHWRPRPRQLQAVVPGRSPEAENNTSSFSPSPPVCFLPQLLLLPATGTTVCFCVHVVQSTRARWLGRRSVFTRCGFIFKPKFKINSGLPF